MSEFASRRYFSNRQKRAMSIVANKIGDADHVIPYSRGGATDVANGRILSPHVNRKKGQFIFEPRDWQVDFLKQWGRRSPGSPFMLIAVPGGGKTFAALKAASDWANARADRQVIVVVPTDGLRVQWRDEAELFGVSLQSKEFGSEFHLKTGFSGAVVTYSYVARNVDVLRALCGRAETMVIFDEIHHCGEEASFGVCAKMAFEIATEKLLLSGTPWKSDGSTIPFVRYDNEGFATADYQYSLLKALGDGVVRYMVFDHSKGSVQSVISGDTTQLCQDTSEATASKILRKLLRPDGEFVREQIAKAHRKLMELRKTVPDAGAMAACIDQQHAQRVAEVIEDVTGCKPSIIVSDDAVQNDTIRDFARSKKEWLVSVRKVSEGANIKRLQVLCYFTTATTELFFRQLVGRVARVRNMEDFEAYVYLPADPRLIRCVENIQEIQVKAREDQDEFSGSNTRDPSDRSLGVEFDPYSTIHDGTDSVYIMDQYMDAEHAAYVERMSEQHGVPMQKMQAIIGSLGLEVPKVETEERREPTLEERADRLRNECNQVAASTAKLRLGGIKDKKLFGIAMSQVHNEANGGTKQEDMSAYQLKAKLTRLVKIHAREERKCKS